MLANQCSSCLLEALVKTLSIIEQGSCQRLPAVPNRCRYEACSTDPLSSAEYLAPVIGHVSSLRIIECHRIPHRR